MFIEFKAQDALKKLRAIQKSTTNLQPFFTEIEPILERAKNQQFASQGSYHGEPWDKLKPSTIKSRSRKGYGGSPILVNTGKLKKSFSTKSKNRNEMVFGSKGVDYYKFHQLGTRKMKSRKMLLFGNPLMREIHEKFKNYINKAMT